MVVLVQEVRSPAQLAEEFELSVQTIRTWVKLAELYDSVRSDGLMTEDPTELRRLRREVIQLRLERNIL